MKNAFSIAFLFVVVAGSAAVGTPAAAATPEQQPMHVRGIDLDVAQAAGATLGHDQDGHDVVTLPSGRTLTLQDGQISSDGRRGVSEGNCGTSTVYGNRTTRKYSTGYVISPSWGAPVSHTWSVTVSTSNSIRAYNNSGLAPICSSGNPTWK